MKKVARAHVEGYGVPPKHVGVDSARPRSEVQSGLKSLRIGVSHCLPGGGIVSIVVEGGLTVMGTDEEYVLGPLDSLAIGPHEGRSVVDT